MAALAGVIALWVFWPCLGYGFLLWDDDNNYTENPYYRGLGPRQLWWMLTTTHMGPYQPLSWVTLGVDYCLWGMNPRGYHLTSILLHAISTALVVWLMTLVLGAWRRTGTDEPVGSPGPPPHCGEPWMVWAGALLAALFWGVHPLRVESV
ncbi:MAG: hypothetical protein JXQ73_16430, partial [Phycisphaerae bacterium]|nr:hypothetical protein [Phycisphaerae bacterium]